MPWFVLYTKSRMEKVVAEKLRAMNVDVYCPLVQRKRQWSDRIKVVEEPLFSSYCFIRVPENERPLVFTVPGFVRYLFWLGKPAVVRDAEIDAIKTMLAQGDHQSIEMLPLTRGNQLTITSGAFQNIVGTVDRQNGNTVTVIVESMQVILKVNIAATSVAI